MVRNYQRRTQKGADGDLYTQESLVRAMQDVTNGNRSTYAAAAFYNIPKSTLRHYVKGTRGKGIVAKDGKGGGGKNILDVETEKQLATTLNTMQKWGYGLSRDETLDLVQMYVTTRNLKTKFQNNRPGEQWFLNFCKRNKLSLKKPQGVEAARKKQENPWTIYGFFDILEQTILELNLQNRPELIFNCDETSFSNDPSKTKVVGPVGSKVTRTISTCGRENTTVLTCCSASGQKLPLLTIFKGKNVIESMIPEKAEPLDRSAVAASQKGWMTTLIFSNWFKKCFLPSVPNERPILLIVDGHVSHISCELIQKALDNQICILKLPPHTTHLLQPLDVGVFKSMKSAWDKTLCKWQRLNPRKKIPKSDFTRLLDKEYSQMPTENIINAFAATGIYIPQTGKPDRTKISQTIFSPQDLRKYNDKNTDVSDTHPMSEQFDADNENEAINEVEKSVNIEDHITNEIASNNQGEKKLTDDNVQKGSQLITALEDEPGPSCAQGSATGSQLNTALEDEPGPSCAQDSATGSQLNTALEDEPGPSCAQDSATGSQLNTALEDEPGPSCAQDSATLTPFEDLLIKLLTKERKNSESPIPPKRRRICTGAEIITTLEYLERKKLEEENKKAEEEKKKAKAEIKSQKTAAKKSRQHEVTNRSFDSEAVTQKKPKKNIRKNEKSRNSDTESCTSASEDDMELLSEDDTENVVSVVDGDFVLVRYNDELYPGKVLELQGSEITLTHMEKNGMFAWRWPQKADILKYDESAVIQVIHEPQPINKRGSYTVPEMNKFNQFKNR